MLQRNPFLVEETSGEPEVEEAEGGDLVAVVLLYVAVEAHPEAVLSMVAALAPRALTPIMPMSHLLLRLISTMPLVQLTRRSNPPPQSQLPSRTE
jgi:hypothetical protein